MECLTYEEARHLLMDFFEIHSGSSNGEAKASAEELLRVTEFKTATPLGTLPTLRVGSALVAYLSHPYKPKHLYLLNGKSAGQGGLRKINLFL